jgi:NitT/TauT family transport system permease protein
MSSIVGNVRTQDIVGELQDRERHQSRRRSQRHAYVWIVRISLLVLFLATWQFLTDSMMLDTLFFSSPRQVLEFLVTQIQTGEFWTDALVTTRETLAGFTIGTALGVAAGLIIAEFDFLARVVTPFLTLLNAMPRVALAPLFIIWFGIGEVSKVVLSVSLVFFIMLINTETGARSVEREFVTVSRAMGASRWQLFTKVTLPATIPSITSGLRVSVVYALLGVIFGEMLSAEQGLGQKMQFHATTFNTAGVFGLLLVLSFLALALSATVTAIERRMLRWRP